MKEFEQIRKDEELQLLSTTEKSNCFLTTDKHGLPTEALAKVG